MSKVKITPVRDKNYIIRTQQRKIEELEAQLKQRERTSQFHKSNHLGAEKQLEAVREYILDMRHEGYRNIKGRHDLVCSVMDGLETALDGEK